MAQAEAIEAIRALTPGHCVRLEGPGGVGKSWAIQQALPDPAQRVMVKHSYDVGHYTLMRYLGLTVKDVQDCGEDNIEGMVGRINKRRQLVTHYKDVVLVLNEVYAMPLYLLKVLAVFMKNASIRLRIVMDGDPYQLLPVKADSLSEDRDHELDKQLQTTVIQFKDSDNKRFKDPDLLDLSTAARLGRLNEGHFQLLRTRKVKGGVASLPLETTILVCKWEQADRYNAQRLASLEGDSVKLYRQQKNRRATLSMEMERVIPKQLELKIGCRVIFVFHVPDLDLVKGDTGIVDAIAPRLKVTVDRTNEQYTLDRLEHPVYKVAQYPVILGWAYNVYRAHGMTLPSVAIDLSEIFAPGQAYTAISRAVCMKGLYILGLNEDAIRRHMLHPACKKK